MIKTIAILLLSLLLLSSRHQQDQANNSCKDEIHFDFVVALAVPVEMT